MRSKAKQLPKDERLSEMLERTTICVPGNQPGVAAHNGEAAFRDTIQQHYSVTENNVAEKLVCLKAQLREASTFDFWKILMERMTSIAGAQFGFAAKRILVDDHDSTVEMPPLGEPGSCLMGVAFYYNDGQEIEHLHRDYKYLAYGSPCQHMKHDKVFIIPNGMPRFIPSNPNPFPFPAEAYLGVPLFAEGKCFGHFGLMWSAKGVEDLQLSWAYIEMLMHSLEDVIQERLIEGQSYAKGTEKKKSKPPPKVIPTEAVTASQSLKPFARSLSHELRTPMQGVVGMLDVMYATVQESLENQKDTVVREVLRTLRENIEVVQDSSRRAVEAADNVVHAYDLNMEVPDTPVPPNDDESVEAGPNVSKPTFLLEGKGGLFRRSKRQRRSDSMERFTGPASKQRHLRSPRSSSRRTVSPHTVSLKTAVEESDGLTSNMEGVISGRLKSPTTNPTIVQQEAHQESLDMEESISTPGLRRSKLREMLHLIINESLRVGGRPDSAIAEDTDGGEIIEVRTKGPDGDTHVKVIEWSVDPQIPETIFVDERDLAKLVSCVFLNAVKFTEEGRITLTATLSSRARFVVIKIADTGPGIPEAFQPFLFKPFSREDDSLTRQKEGLGLGLLVAKGLARKVGGELTCVRTNVDGPLRGSEFELRVPLHSGDSGSRAATPSRTPSPAFRTNNEPHSPSKFRHNSLAEQHFSPHGTLASPTSAGTPEPFEKVIHPSRRNSLSPPQHPRPPPPPTIRRPSTKQAPTFDRHLAKKYPLSFLVVEDNNINRRLLVNMLGKLGYKDIHEAHDGVEAVHQMHIDRASRGERPIDVVLMDLWMPNMDGYEATEHIVRFDREKREEQTQEKQKRHDGGGVVGSDDEADYNTGAKKKVTILAVTADVTDSALERASEVGMEGFMPKPYNLLDLERLILEHCAGSAALVQV